MACVPPKQWILVVDGVLVLNVVNIQFIYFVGLLVMGRKRALSNFFGFGVFFSELTYVVQE